MTAGCSDLKRGWCPGALRPMESGDGLLIRIKPSCGRLGLDQAVRVASLAGEYGNGLIELTSRGNLQLRGVRGDTLPPLTAALDGLGLLDETPEAEAVRNVISTPLAGLDSAAFDTRAVAARVEARLRTQAAELFALSDKFGFVIDGGGALPLTNVEADIRFAWTGAAFAVGLARDSATDWIGSCVEGGVPDVAIALTRHFMANGAGARRMRDFPEAHRGPAARVAGVRDEFARPHAPVQPSGIQLAGCLRPANAMRADGPVIVSIGFPYGGAPASALSAWLATVLATGATQLRVTPWRAVLVPVPAAALADRLLESANALGFITSPDDPRRAVAACPGAPACGNGSTPVRMDADRLSAAAAPLLVAGAAMHVSGCRKGCARRLPAALTLVAEAGRYGLVVNGAANATPCGRFTADEAAETLARLASAMTKAGYENGAGDTAAIETALKEILAA